jgi:hypothetical protein
MVRRAAYRSTGVLTRPNLCSSIGKARTLDRLTIKRLVDGMIATQLPLFETAAPTSPRARSARRLTRVQYEPAVAEAVARHDRLGCDLRSAFVSFWASLSPERKAEIRARLAA